MVLYPLSSDRSKKDQALQDLLSLPKNWQDVILPTQKKLNTWLTLGFIKVLLLLACIVPTIPSFFVGEIHILLNEEPVDLLVEALKEWFELQIDSYFQILCHER